MISKYIKSSTKKLDNKVQQPDENKLSHRNRSISHRESSVTAKNSSRRNDSSFKNASISGITTSPNLRES